MPHRIAFHFEDGVTRFIDVHEGELVADAAYRQDVHLPLDCRDGACGTCKCYAEAGRYDLGQEYIEAALSADEARRGYVLACQMRVHSDCVIRVPASSSACRTQPISVEARIADLQRLSDTTFALRLQDEALASLPFLPGQYVNLLVPGTDQRRAYSFSSLTRDGEASFLIRNVPGGVMSSYLVADAREGDRITLDGPRGSFYLREVCRPVLMLAGGTGLAPFLAMLERLAGDGCPQPIHLVYGVTNAIDLVALEQLAAAAARLPTFTWDSCVVDRASDHPRLGYVTDHLDADQLSAGEFDLYLCGPPPMVDAVQRYLNEQAISPQNFYYEKFAPTL